jgi:hypothetical protein
MKNECVGQIMVNGSGLVAILFIKKNADGLNHTASMVTPLKLSLFMVRERFNRQLLLYH